MIRKFLVHPLMRGQDIDAPETIHRTRQVIRQKHFLRQLYIEWYGLMEKELASSSASQNLELGSGAGFLHQFIPALIRSDIQQISDIDVVLDGRSLPFRDKTLANILMMNVLHHISDPRLFFLEASRCLVPEGRVIMIEPWKTSFSSFVYRYFHYEAYEPDAKDWNFQQQGPLTGANEALPWIIFGRDLDLFKRDFTEFQIEKLRLHTPFRYLLSGGVTMRRLVPDWSFNFWKWVEQLISPIAAHTAMFATIVIRKS